MREEIVLISPEEIEHQKEFALKIQGMADRPQTFHIVTYGRANMPPQAGLLSPQDRWAVILHIRSLQTPAAPRAAGAKP